jgi:hypothetical protein
MPVGLNSLDVSRRTDCRSPCVYVVGMGFIGISLDADIPSLPKRSLPALGGFHKE